jgi:hypothetical protein
VLEVRGVAATMAQSSGHFKRVHGPPAQLLLVMGHRGPTGKVSIELDIESSAAELEAMEW